MRVLDRNISENTEKILHHLFLDKETSFPVEYEYTPEETSSVTFLGDKYIIKLQKSISDQLVFEDTLLHEYTHIYQVEHEIPYIDSTNIPNEYSYIVDKIGKTVLDIDVNCILRSFGYAPLSSTIKYDTYYPIFRKIKKSFPEPSKEDILEYSIELAFIYFTDSKKHCLSCLSCIEKATYSVSKITYAFIDVISDYISSPRNNEAILQLYSKLKGIILNSIS
nr:MAG TPA: hypothetical protein [Caudoviricetes sp.]